MHHCATVGHHYWLTSVVHVRSLAAELPDLKAACPDNAELNAQVMQDVLLRLERAFVERDAEPVGPPAGAPATQRPSTTLLRRANICSPVPTHLRMTAVRL
jgi:hypothetical protein